LSYPRIGIRISGDDGGPDTKWTESFVLDLPSILDTEVVHRRSQVRSAIGYLMAWDRALDQMCDRVALNAVREKIELERHIA
jgi:hypothetical protein